MLTTLSEYAASRELLINLTLRELRTKYKRSVLGWAWSLLNPVALMLIYTLIFQVFLRVQPPAGASNGLKSFPLFLLSGLLAWNFVVNATNGSIDTLLINANLIKKTYFPRELLVASQVTAWFVSLLIEMLLLCVAFMVSGNLVLAYVPITLLILVALAAFVTGMGLAFSVVNVYFRDVRHLVGIAFQLWFYLSPILYPVSLVKERVELLGVDLPARTIYNLNPMVSFVEAIRDCLYDLQVPSAARMGSLLLVSAGTFLAGLYLFKRLEGRLAEEL
ncbi:MAG: ABC transporter permease [Actinomycetota bacterium]|nr:ABC transporter permease [Actinomycetota bacterium]